MKKRISLGRAITISMTGMIISYIVFLMIEVLWADLIQDYLNSLYSDDVYYIILLILLIGLFFSFIISFVIFSLLVKGEKMSELWIGFIGFVLTLITLTAISMLTVEMYYKDEFKDFTVFEKLLLIPQYIVFFAIFVLPSPIFFWDVATVIFGIYMIPLIHLFIYEDTSKKAKEKIKPIRERII
jgi:hypothetical protein